jgi:hypothetical protein
VRATTRRGGGLSQEAVIANGDLEKESPVPCIRCRASHVEPESNAMAGSNTSGKNHFRYFYFQQAEL